MKNSVQIIEIETKKSKTTGNLFKIVTFSDESTAFMFEDIPGVEEGNFGVPELEFNPKLQTQKIVGFSVTGKAEVKQPDWDAKDRGKAMGGVTHGAVGQVVAALIASGELKAKDVEAAITTYSTLLYGLTQQAQKDAIAYPGWEP